MSLNSDHAKMRMVKNLKEDQGLVGALRAAQHDLLNGALKRSALKECQGDLLGDQKEAFLENLFQIEHLDLLSREIVLGFLKVLKAKVEVRAEAKDPAGPLRNEPKAAPVVRLNDVLRVYLVDLLNGALRAAPHDLLNGALKGNALREGQGDKKGNVFLENRFRVRKAGENSQVLGDLQRGEVSSLFEVRKDMRRQDRQKTARQSVYHEIISKNMYKGEG
jgi:hypothetical protein